MNFQFIMKGFYKYVPTNIICTRLGFLVDFISLPVTTGFTAAAAFTIASAQIKNFLGIESSASGVVDSWVSVLTNLNKISWPDTILGVVTVLALLLGRVSIYN